MSSNEIAISVKDLSKTYQVYDKPIDRLKQTLVRNKKYYKEFSALNKLSFSVNRGQTIGIIGVNGSGKSTLLQMLTGTLQPTTGTIQIKGRIAALLELGSGFNPEFTGRENVYLNGSILGVSEIEMENRFEEIEKFAGIGEFIDQPVKTYSSGMYVRLAFAVAINVDADILIVDEALAVGDVYFQAKCYKKFEEYKKMGKTIILVTHDLGSIIKYCDNVILLNKGDLHAIGHAKEMVDEYKKLIVSNNKTTLINNTINENVNSFDTLKENHEINPTFNEYGNKMIEIIDFGIMNDLGDITSQIDKNENFIITMRIKVNAKVEYPIFAYTIKDLKGNEITGTNTMLENKLLSQVEESELIEITFEQKMQLQGGHYILSLGCTGFIDNEFVVYHRLYDVLSIQVLSSKDSVGFFDSNAVIKINNLGIGDFK